MSVSIRAFPAPPRPLSPPAGETELFRSDLLSVVDWRCAGHDSTRDELSGAHQVIVARRGAFVRESEGRRTFVDASVVGFWNPEETYRVRHPLPGGDSCSVFLLPSGAVASLLARYHPRALDVPRLRFPAAAAPLDGRAFLTHRIALAAARREGAMPLEVEELAVEFLHRALATPDERAAEPPRASAAEYAARVRETIAARFRERLSLGDIARAVHCSPYHLSRLVTAVEGVSIHRLIVRLRLREALERLLETGDQVARIALEVGFGSHSRFTEAFRREFGVTPRAARALSGGAIRSLARRS